MIQTNYEDSTDDESVVEVKHEVKEVKKGPPKKRMSIHMRSSKSVSIEFLTSSEISDLRIRSRNCNKLKYPGCHMFKTPDEKLTYIINITLTQQFVSGMKMNKKPLWLLRRNTIHGPVKLNTKLCTAVVVPHIVETCL